MTEFVPLAELGEIVSGSTPDTNKPEYWNGDIPWITPADLTDSRGIYFLGNLRKITQAGFKNCSTRMLPTGSILFSSRAPIGHCAVTAFPLCTNQGFKSIIPNKRLNPLYGYFALRFFTPAIVAMGRGATFAEINKEIFETFRIPIPSNIEQERIATLLQKADHLRRTRRYAQQLSDTFLQSVFLEMFGNPASNPMGWDSVTIDEMVSKSQYGSSEKSNAKKSGYPILGMSNLTYTGDIDLTAYSYVDLPTSVFQELRLVPGDIIFNRTNSTELVGKTAHWSRDMEAVLASYLVKLQLEANVLPDFFASLLNSAYFKRLFQERCKKAIGQSNISPTLLKEFRAYLPPVAFQEKYALIVRSMERLRAQQREATRQAEHLFQTLLHQAFRCEL